MFRGTTIILIIGMAFVSTVLAAPKATITDNSFDFGKIVQHTKVSHTFWIKSTGTEPLRITKIVPGCGCTQIPLTDSVIAPGDSTALEILFSSKSFYGRIVKTPSIFTNASDEKIGLMIKAEVLLEPDSLMPLRVTPYEVDVSQAGERERRYSIFLIENLTNRDYTLKLVDGNAGTFKVTLPEMIKAGETVEGMVVVNDVSTAKDFEKSITFEIGDDFHTRYTLPVKRLTGSP
ncbi:MAG: DUF1573 domain-containing protein [Candidatus Zixiibacteriota bacterium]